MMSFARLENLPKLWDSLDSGLFVLRTRLAGHAGLALSNALFCLALVLAIAAHPITRDIVLGALSAYLVATLCARLAILPWRPRRALTRQTAPG